MKKQHKEGHACRDYDISTQTIRIRNMTKGGPVSSRIQNKVCIRLGYSMICKQSLFLLRQVESVEDIPTLPRRILTYLYQISIADANVIADL